MKLVLLPLTVACAASVAFCDGGEASDANGDTGREVAVRVEGTDDVRLEIDFGQGWENASTMTLMSTELTEVPVFPVEICDRGEQQIFPQAWFMELENAVSVS